MTEGTRSTQEIKKELEGIGIGDHLCCIYKSKEEQLSIVIPFMSIGLGRNEKCIYIIDENSERDIIQAFQQAGIDIDKYIASRQFEFFTKEDAYLKGGYFDPDKMLDLLKHADQNAIKSGYAGLRVTGEMTWVFTKLPGVDGLIEYEARLNYFFPQSKSLALCQYNQNRFGPEVLLEVIHTHPKVVIYNTICDNPYYIPPDAYIAKMKGEIRLEIYERIRDDIIRRAGQEEEHRRAHEEILSIARFPSEDPSPVVRLNAEGKIMYRNPATAKLLKESGLSQDEIFKIFPVGLIGLIKKALDENKPLLGSEVEISGKVYEYTIAPLVEWQYVNLYGVDITERKKLQEVLRQEKERAEKYLRMAGFIIIGININGEINLINKKGCDVLKCKESEAVGKNWFDNFVPAQNRGEIMSVFKKLVSGEIGIVEYYENPVLTKDGSERTIAWYNSLVRDDSGNIVGTISSGEDITERRVAEKKLKQAVVEWDRTFNAISDLVFIQDANSVILKANKAFIDSIKLKEEDIIGRKCYEVCHKLGTSWPNCPFQMSRQDKKTHTEEVDDPNIGIPLLITVSPIFDDAGEVVGAVHIAKDISAIKNTQKELQKKIDDLEIFHKAAVDRELKMIELKKRVVELEGKLKL